MWFQLLAQFVSQESQGLHVQPLAPPPVQNDTIIWVLVAGGLGVAGFVAYQVLKD